MCLTFFDVLEYGQSGYVVDCSWRVRVQWICPGVTKGCVLCEVLILLQSTTEHEAGLSTGMDHIVLVCQDCSPEGFHVLEVKYWKICTWACYVFPKDVPDAHVGASRCMVPDEIVQWGGDPEDGWLPIRGNRGSGSHTESEIPMKGVVLLSPILQEITVTHGAVGHVVADRDPMGAVDCDASLEVVVEGVVSCVGLLGVDPSRHMPVDWVAAFDTLLAHLGQFHTSDLESFKALPGLDVAAIGIPLILHLPRDFDIPGE